VSFRLTIRSCDAISTASCNCRKSSGWLIRRRRSGELKETFAAAVKALNARDLDGFLAAVHPNSLSFYSCGPTSGKEGKEACRADWVKFFSYSGPANFDAANFEARIVAIPVLCGESILLP
jgi:hypothetical protein